MVEEEEAEERVPPLGPLKLLDDPVTWPLERTAEVAAEAVGGELRRPLRLVMLETLARLPLLALERVSDGDRAEAL